MSLLVNVIFTIFRFLHLHPGMNGPWAYCCFRPTVIYFWSQTQMNQYRNSLNRLKKLKKAYPKIRFIGIGIQPFNALTDQIQKMMGVENKDQFALTNFEKASKVWVLTLLNKSIALNKNYKPVFLKDTGSTLS